jgi:hypothetical protein
MNGCLPAPFPRVFLAGEDILCPSMNTPSRETLPNTDWTQTPQHTGPAYPQPVPSLRSGSILGSGPRGSIQSKQDLHQSRGPEEKGITDLLEPNQDPSHRKNAWVQIL